MILAQQDSRPLVEFNTSPLFEESGLALAVMGMLVVFLALVLVVMFISLLPRIAERLHAGTTPTPTPGLAIDGDELSQETIAVIAAAVAATITQPHRIVRIRGLTPADLGWSLEGRMQHHHSHSIPQRSRR